jgi:D-3-phosphoglycerate dehydrogenase
MASVTPEETPRLAPYMSLVKQLGSFAGQITQEGVREITIEYEGAAAGLNTKPLTAMILEGILSPSLESINMVNAPLVARDRSIEIVEVKREFPCDYNSMVRLTIQTESRTAIVAGTLFGGHPRLTHVDGINIEAELGPHMLFVRNQDKPGFIGSFGVALGVAGVNIATFHLGRGSVGGEAIALIEVDQPVTENILGKVLSLPNVVQVKPLSFEQRM